MSGSGREQMPEHVACTARLADGRRCAQAPAGAPFAATHVGGGGAGGLLQSLLGGASSKASQPTQEQVAAGAALGAGLARASPAQAGNIPVSSNAIHFNLPQARPDSTQAASAEPRFAPEPPASAVALVHA